MFRYRIMLLAVIFAWSCAVVAPAQERSVKPGINDSFADPDPKAFVERFEIESREVFARRKEIAAACAIRPGQTVADIGAGTGLFTRIFSPLVGKDGRVIAVDISKNFLEHIDRTSREAGLQNVETLLCTADSTELPEASVDVAFICDTYHHFEFPFKTMASLHKAMKPGGRVILIDFRREEGKSTDWVLNHVRAGQEVFEEEIIKSGFEKQYAEGEILKENYFVVFRKPELQENHADHGPGPGRGRGMGQGRGLGQGRGPAAGFGRGPGADMRADQEVFHFLLEHHSEIRRSVKKLDDGVETLTESENAEVASKIQEHAASMHRRIKEGRGLRFWDDLFAAIFKHSQSIDMVVENTDSGVRVRETSKVPAVALLIQAHADVVSAFVANGFDEAHRNHAVPDSPSNAATPATPAAQLTFAIIKSSGGILPRPNAVEQPRAGAKVLLDTTADAKPGDLNKGLDRAARLLNLYGASGLKSSDVRIAVVLHGEATKSVLNDESYHKRFGVERNPNLPLIRELQEAGVEVLVCGQALNYKNFADAEVAEGIPIAVSALTVVINKQTDGYAVMVLP